MRTTIRTILLASCMLTHGAIAAAQDQEEGPVELAPASDEVSTTAEVSTSGSASASYGPATPQDAPRTGRESVGALRVYGGFRLGVGGGFKPIDVDGAPDDILALAKATPGLQLGVDYVVMDYFAIGGETRLSWPGYKAGGDRLMLWDVVVKPRARMLLSSYPLELYAALPFGISVANFPNDERPEITGKAHATLGLSAGAYYFFNQHMGINAEMGWLWNWIRGEVDLGATTATSKQRLGQFTLLNVNFVYAF